MNENVSESTNFTQPKCQLLFLKHKTILEDGWKVTTKRKQN